MDCFVASLLAMTISVNLPPSRIGPRFDQLRRALIANESALIGDHAEFDVEARGEVLVRNTGNDPIATHAPVLVVDPLTVCRFLRKRDMCCHRAILRVQPTPQFVRNTLGSYSATSASPSLFSCWRCIEKQTEKPSVVHNVTIPCDGSEACSTTQDSRG